MLIKRLPWAEQPSDIVTPHERWLNLGLKSAYLLQPHLWTINLVTGRIGGTHVGTGVSFVGGKLRTPGTSGNGALLDHGVAVNIAAPISMVVGCEHVSGSTDWGLLRNTANWYGWYSDATGAIKTANNNVFNGSLTLGGNGSVAFRHTSNADLTGSSGAGVSTDATTTLPTTVDRTQITLGYSRRSVSDAPAVADFTHFYVFNTALSDGALVELANEPHRLWEDRRIWVPVSLASSNVTITGTPGNAAAAGTSATVNQARSATGTTGNAAAAGVTAKINQARTVTGAVGNAVSAGVTATVNRATSIAATPGNAVAAGVNATITAAGAVVITGTPGNASAAGVSARINQARSVTGTAGNAVAAGVQATISTAGAGVTITATPGNAFASGPQAIIVRNVAIAAAVGNAVAAGRQATVSNITATDDLYPLEGMSQDYPLQGMTQTYPLAGQTPS